MHPICFFNLHVVDKNWQIAKKEILRVFVFKCYFCRKSLVFSKLIAVNLCYLVFEVEIWFNTDITPHGYIHVGVAEEDPFPQVFFMKHRSNCKGAKGGGGGCLWVTSPVTLVIM